MSEETEFNIARMRKKADRERADRERRFNGARRNGENKGSRGNDFGWTRPNAGRNGHSNRRPEYETRERFERALPYTPPLSTAPEAVFKVPFDPWRLLEAMRARWQWLLAGAFGLFLAALVLSVWMTRYSVSLSLMRRENPNAFRSGEAAETFMPRELSEQTLMNLMRAPEVIRRVAERAKPPQKPEDFAKRSKVSPTQNPDIVVLTVFGKDNLPGMVDLLNIYAEEVIKYTREMQASESGQVNDFLKQKLEYTEKEIQQVKEELLKFSRDAGFVNFEKETEAYLAQLGTLDLDIEKAKIEAETLDLQIKAFKEGINQENPVNEKLQKAKDDLASLLLTYTEAHPAVQKQRAVVEALEKQAPLSLPKPGSKAAVITGPMAAQIREWEVRKQAAERKVESSVALKRKEQEKGKQLSEKALQYAVIKSKLNSLETSQALLATRQRETQLFVSNAMGYYRPIAPAKLSDLHKKTRWVKVAMISSIGGFLGFLCAAGLVLLAEAVDTRLKTVEDIERITGLPVLATLGDLKKMSPDEQISWAFRTLTLLRGKLNRSPNQGLVCGFISSGHGEGRSTWINLLVSAASQRGLKVLTVDTRPTAAQPNFTPKDPVDDSGPENTLTSNVLARAADVAQQLAGETNQPVVHIPLPGWVWNLERRTQWQEAMEHWRKIDNLVLLVELPPASQDEAVLLAENLPQLIWLTGSGMADSDRTNEQIETLRHARCNLVGAVLNYQPSDFWRRHLGRWINRAAAAAVLALWLPLAMQAQEQITTPTNLAFSVSSPARRAAWQQRLTLGPGDAIDIHLFGSPELSKTNMFIGPDGRLSFLQAQNIPAAGMTIDELRARLDKELAKYYRTARTIIVPVAFSSKKYFVLGKVGTKGVFTLDRPTTVIEAVARARGLETGLYERTTVEMADLGRSFLIRQGKKIPLNFEKLFYEGDLSQNIPIEPNDYLYFAAAGVNEIYVLGEVINPGPLGFVPNATLITALADRGGWTTKAYKQRVLIIRGSLNQPETFAVDTKAILEANAPDFKLQPKDIVYVARRPWAKVEELLDTGLQAFIEGAITTWTGANVGPIIGNPILPQL